MGLFRGGLGAILKPVPKARGNGRAVRNVVEAGEEKVDSGMPILNPKPYSTCTLNPRL